MSKTTCSHRCLPRGSQVFPLTALTPSLRAIFEFQISVLLHNVHSIKKACIKAIKTPWRAHQESHISVQIIAFIFMERYRRKKKIVSFIMIAPNLSPHTRKLCIKAISLISELTKLYKTLKCVLRSIYFGFRLERPQSSLKCTRAKCT